MKEHEEAIEKLAKVTEAKERGELIDQTGEELEMLIEIVSNLKIEDATLVWSGDRLMDLNKYQALHMKVKRVGGADYLFVESGGFSNRHKPDWKSKWLVLGRP